MLPQQIQIDPGSYIKSLYKGLAHHIGQVAVTRFILAQQYQMSGFGVILVYLVKSGTGRHIDLTADDRVDPLCLAGPVKVNSAVHHTMVGNGAGGLAHLFDAPGQVTDAAGAVQQAILRMDVKMHE